MKNFNGMKIFKKASIHLLLMSFFLLPVFVLAQDTSVGVRINNPFNCGGATKEADCTLMTLITSILNNVVMPVAAVGVVIWIVYAGFTFLTAQGNPKKVEEAQQRLLWSLIGAGILLGAAAISAVVESTVRGLTTP